MTAKLMHKAAADTAPPAGVALRSPASGDSSIRPGLTRWRVALEGSWQRKIDEIVALSRATCGLSADPGETLAVPGARSSRRLGARASRAYEELAAIESAMARVDDGTYGICAGCDQPMGEEWLADKPETRYCPDCSLRLVTWRPRSKQTVAGLQRPAPAAMV